MTWRRRLFVYIGASLVAFVTLAGAAHTDAGRSLMRWLPGGCPLDRGPMTAEQLDRSRRAVLTEYRAERSAERLSVLGFDLERSTRAEVRAWARKVASTCEPRGVAQWRCTEPPSRHGSTVRTFTFDQHERLVALDTSIHTRDPTQAVRHLEQRSNQLTAGHGAPTSARGRPTEEYLRRGPLRHIGYEYRFSNLRTTLTATNLGHDQFVVRETWQSVLASTRDRLHLES